MTIPTTHVTLRADDAIIAFTALRSWINESDRILRHYGGHDDEVDAIARHREENWQAYQRIAKALGLRPTL